MEDGTDQQRVTGLLPVVAPLHCAFGIDEDIRDVLDVPHLMIAPANLEQGVVCRGRRIGRVEQ